MSSRKKANPVSGSSLVSVPKSHSAQKITLQKEKEETAEDLETVSRSLELQHATDEARPGFIDSLEQLFGGGAESGTDLLEHPCPPGKKSKLMKTDLMSFQSKGLAWMIKMEHPRLPETVNDKPVQLWVRGEDSNHEVFWFNLATGTSQREAPILKRGGLLADDMGLGKTVQMIALIMTDDTGGGVIDPPEDPDDRFDDMTLIICPVSVASNWTDQLNSHVGSKRLSWHLYHGDGREISEKKLKKQDVVITTYEIIAREWFAKNEEEPASKKSKLSKEESYLHMIKWRRIVLDEGHVIKNPKTQISIACNALTAERRWILTGTPIINYPSDFGTVIKFLQVCKPLDDASQWKKVVESKEDSDPAAQVTILRAIVASTTLRRTKGMSSTSGNLITLPAVEVIIRDIEMDQSAQDLYREVETEFLRRMEGYKKIGSDLNLKSANVFLFTLRLRQIACDPSLCPESFVEDLRSDQIDPKQLGGEEDLAEEVEVEAVPVEPRESGPETVRTPGAKAKELIRLLRASEEGVKSLIFSQWRGHLDCIEAALNAAGIVSCRFDGTMTQKAREKVIAIFSAALEPSNTKKQAEGNDSNVPSLAAATPTVMLLSLKAGALGLNLTCASQVFLMDPWWQSSIEKQAINRVHRIGQTKNVMVYRMVAKDTVESQVLAVQAKKESLIQECLSGKEMSVLEIQREINSIF